MNKRRSKKIRNYFQDIFLKFYFILQERETLQYRSGISSIHIYIRGEKELPDSSLPSPL
jgi:hypothetical protein